MPVLLSLQSCKRKLRAKALIFYSNVGFLQWLALEETLGHFAECSFETFH